MYVYIIHSVHMKFLQRIQIPLLSVQVQEPSHHVFFIVRCIIPG